MMSGDDEETKPSFSQVEATKLNADEKGEAKKKENSREAFQSPEKERVKSPFKVATPKRRSPSFRAFLGSGRSGSPESPSRLGLLRNAVHRKNAVSQDDQGSASELSKSEPSPRDSTDRTLSGGNGVVSEKASTLKLAKDGDRSGRGFRRTESQNFMQEENSKDGDQNIENKQRQYSSSDLRQDARLQHLVGIWKSYRECVSTQGSKKMEKEKSLQLLHEFVVSYNKDFSRWNCEFHYGNHLANDLETVRRRMAVPPLDSDVAVNIHGFLQGFVHDFSMHVGIQGTSNEKGSTKDYPPLDAVYLLNLLSRSSANVQLLMNGGSPLLTQLIKVLRVAALRVSDLPNVSSSEQVEFSEVYLQTLLGHCFHTILNFLGGPGWLSIYEPIGYENPSTLSSGSSGISSNISSKSGGSSCAQAPAKRILQGGALFVVKDQLVTLVKKEKPLQGSQYDLLMMLLCTVGALTRHSVNAQNKLRDAGILELLLELIGWPSYILPHPSEEETASRTQQSVNLDDSEKKDPNGKDRRKVLEAEFELQLLALKCLAEAIEKNPLNSQRLSALGGNQKAMDMILWVTEVFSIDPHMNSTSDLDLLSSTGLDASEKKVAHLIDGGEEGCMSPSYLSMTVQHYRTIVKAPQPVPRKRCMPLARTLNVLFAMCVGTGNHDFVRGERVPVVSSSSSLLDASSSSSRSSGLPEPKRRSNTATGIHHRKGATRRSGGSGNTNGKAALSSLNQIGSSHNILSHSGSPTGLLSGSDTHDHSSSLRPRAGTDRSKAVRVTLRLLVDLFNMDVLNHAHNRRVRDKLINGYPELQLFVLEFIVELVRVDERALDLARRYKFLDVLLGSYFWQARPKSGVYDLFGNLVHYQKGEKQLALYQKLRGAVLDSIRFIVCFRNRTVMDSEVSTLLNMLEKNYENVPVCSGIAQTLVEIGSYSGHCFQRGVLRGNGMSILIDIINGQRELYDRFFAERDAKCMVTVATAATGTQTAEEEIQREKVKEVWKALVGEAGMDVYNDFSASDRAMLSCLRKGEDYHLELEKNPAACRSYAVDHMDQLFSPAVFHRSRSVLLLLLGHTLVNNALAISSALAHPGVSGAVVSLLPDPSMRRLALQQLLRLMRVALPHTSAIVANSGSGGKNGSNEGMGLHGGENTSALLVGSESSGSSSGGGSGSGRSSSGMALVFSTSPGSRSGSGLGRDGGSSKSSGGSSSYGSSKKGGGSHVGSVSSLPQIGGRTCVMLVEESRPHLSRLYTEYFNVMQQAQAAGHDDGFQLQLALLEGLRSLAEVHPATQLMFKEVGAFLNVINLLNAEKEERRLPELCVAVLRTLADMIRGCSPNKMHLKTIGYDNLCRLILRALDSEPAEGRGHLRRDLVSVLLNMLVDGKFDVENRYTICTPDVVPLLFQLSTRLPLQMQEKLMDTFIKLVESCMLNCSLCCSRHLIFLLLDLIPTYDDEGLLAKALRLVELLGTHSITVRELKRLFQLTNSLAGGFRPRAQMRLLRGLEFMALSSNQGPEVFFDLDGTSSGIALPVIERFPHNHGFTFTTWLRAESFQDPNNKPKFEPRLFSFLTSSGQGLEAYFAQEAVPGRGGRLCLQTTLRLRAMHPNGKLYTLAFNEVRFTPKLWCFIALTHANHSRHPFKDSEVRLYVDGRLEQKANFKYCPFVSPVTFARLGTNAEVHGTGGFRFYRETPFYGQMGSVYLFDEVLNAAQIKGINHLGPDYAANFHASEGVGETGSAGTRSSVLDGTLTSHIFLTYNCRAVRGDVLLDSTPQRNRERPLHARLLGSIHSCITRDIKSQIHCLGGIKVLLPLFAQLDQPLAPLNPGDPVDYDPDPALPVQVLNVLREVLCGNAFNEEDMLRCHGFDVIGFLLRKVSPRHISSTVLNTLRELATKVQNSELMRQFYRSIFGDLRLWCFASAKVQNLLLQAVHGWLRTSPRLYRPLFDVPWALDALERFYWYVPGSYAIGQEPVLHPVTREVIGTRAQEDDLKGLRRTILNILQVLMADEFSGPDVERWLCSLNRTVDTQHLVELLDITLRVLLDPSFTHFLQKMPAACDAPCIFILLMRNSNEKVRATCLRILGAIFVHPLRRGRNKADISVYMTAATDVLTTYPCGELTMEAMFAVLVDRPKSEGIELDDELEIRQPFALRSIFRLLQVCSIEYRERVLQRVYLLLSNSYENREVMLGFYSWQKWLFTLLSDPEVKKLRSQSGGEQSVVDLISMNMLRLLHLHRIQYEKGGHRMLEQTLAFLDAYADRGVLDAVPITRTLLCEMMKSIRAEASKRRSTKQRTNLFVIRDPSMAKKTSFVMPNLVQLVQLVEDFVFYAIVDQRPSSPPLRAASPPFQSSSHSSLGGSPSSPTMTPLAVSPPSSVEVGESRSHTKSVSVNPQRVCRDREVKEGNDQHPSEAERVPSLEEKKSEKLVHLAKFKGLEGLRKSEHKLATSQSSGAMESYLRDTSKESGSSSFSVGEGSLSNASEASDQGTSQKTRVRNSTTLGRGERMRRSCSDGGSTVQQAADARTARLLSTQDMTAFEAANAQGGKGSVDSAVPEENVLSIYQVRESKPERQNSGKSAEVASYASQLGISPGSTAGLSGGGRLMMRVCRDAQGVWEDNELCVALLETLVYLDMLGSSRVLSALQTGKGVQPIRPGGVNRVALRLAITAMEEADVQGRVRILPMIRRVLADGLADVKEDLAPRLAYVLYRLLGLLQNDARNASAAAALAAEKEGDMEAKRNANVAAKLPKAIVPLTKDLIRWCMPSVRDSLSPEACKELERLSSSSTIPKFIAALDDRPLRLLYEQLSVLSRIVVIEHENYAAELEKTRLKIQNTTEKQLEKVENADAAEDRRMSSAIILLREKLTQNARHVRKDEFSSRAKHDKATAWRWRQIFRSVANERAPWGSRDEHEVRHWKLDKSENPSRMRYTLKRNYKFDPHEGCARSMDGAEDGIRSPQGERSSAAVAAAAAAAAVVKATQSGAVNIAGGVDGSGDVLSQAGSPNSLKALESGIKLSDVVRLRSGADQGDGAPLEEKAAAAAVDSEGDESKVLYVASCERITPMNSTPGRLEISAKRIQFWEEQDPEDVEAMQRAPKDRKWHVDAIREIHLRRYRLRRSALEIFFVDRSNVFLNFDTKERNRVFHKLLLLRPPNLVFSETGSPAEILRRSGLMKLWQERRISNFDYLMQLNTIAGRTYNDLSQYPVFPWVLSNYTSKSIDLNDPRCYRDLGKPIGALNPDRLEKLLIRYRDAVDESSRFLYGTHYSNTAIVLSYLIRMEPFTTMFLKLQGGKFDIADRMFDSVPRTWANVLSNPADFKELIPEFFYMPEFLQNRNGFELGYKQEDGLPIGDVELPAWASSAEEFVRMNRRALESEYVSANLHKWINLIFGFKQKGREAERANNVFYFLTYEGAVDLDAIEDDHMRRATESQLDYYGQTPCQLLDKPHPERRPDNLTISMFDPSMRSRLSITSIQTSREAIVFIGLPRPTTPSYLAAVPGQLFGDRVVLVDGGQFNVLLRCTSHVMGSGISGSSTAVPVSAADVESNSASNSKSGNSGGSRSAVVSPGIHSTSTATTSKSNSAPSPASNISPRSSAANGQVVVPDLSPKPSRLVSSTSMANATVSGRGDHHHHHYVGSNSSLVSGSLLSEEDTSDRGLPFELDVVQGNRYRVGTPFAAGMTPSHACFALTNDGRTMISCGHWDSTVKFMHADTARLQQSVHVHKDIVTCLALDRDGRTLITGSKDTTLIIMHLVRSSSGWRVKEKDVDILYGHNDEITCVAINTELDVALSGSKDGTCIVHTVQSGHYVRSLYHPTGAVIDLIAISNQGHLVCYSRQDLTIRVYSINGDPLCAVDVQERLHSLLATRCGDTLLTAGYNGVLEARLLPNLVSQSRLKTNKANKAIRSIALSPDENQVFLGLDDGQLVIVNRAM